MNTKHIPDFLTLDQPPSWLNANGRIDRSACCEVTVGEVRRLAKSVQYEYRRVNRKPVRLPIQPLPNERPARNRHGRIATGVFRLTADHLLTVLARRLPRGLAGDWRTSRAHVMRPRWFQPGQRVPFRAGCKDAGVILPFDAGLEGNPNKGASRTKVIGIWLSWYQPVRIEKWRFPTRELPGYFLVCPGHALAKRMQSLDRKLDRSGPGKRKRIEDHLARVRKWMLGQILEDEGGSGPPPLDDDPRLPPLSTRGPGREDPKSGKCPQRTYKLMMPLCTRQEFHDAWVAQLWIDSLPRQRMMQHQELIAALRSRYGLLFQPRILLCPRCLGVRYGNDPEGPRQAYRRKVGKPDARPAKRIVKKSNNWKWAQQTKRETRRKRSEGASENGAQMS